MPASASQRSSAASDTPVSSPLARAPRFLPPTSKAVSPVRRPLHERSSSQSNQYAGPTIRLVDDQGSPVYSKTPFPSEPSQILPPRKVPGYAFERRGSRVSDTVAKIEASQTTSQTLAPKPVQSKKFRHSTSTNTSDADTLVASSFSPISSRFSQDSTTRSSPTPDSLFRNEKEFEVLQEVPSSPLRSTIRTVAPSAAPSTASSAEAPSEGHALTPRASAASLASTASAESLVQDNANHNRHTSNNTVVPSTENYQIHPASSGSDLQKQASSTNTTVHRPKSRASTHSFAYTDYSYNSERPRSASQPVSTLHEAQTATVTTGVRVNYPTVRAASASSLWASSQEHLPTISSRMNPPPRTQVHHWSSQLSTIASESERGSRSIERASRSFSARSQSQDDFPGNGRTVVPRRRQTVGSVSSSDNVSLDPTESSIAVPLPLFSPITGPSNNDRNSDSEFEERHDTISPLQSPPLRMKTSFIRRRDSDSRSPNSSRPSSSQSDLSTFIANTIPAWARVYYRRGDRTSLGAPESISEESSVRLPTSHSGRTNTPSEGNFPFSIYNPRRRQHQRVSGAESTSMSEGPVEQDVYVVGGPRRHVLEQFTPRLRPDHRSQAQLSAWKAPSFDENFGAALFSRQNRQIVCFCLGFIFPFAWMIAALLPLPPDPKTVQGATASELDIEQRFDNQFGPIVDKSYQKANWWRNLNRVMSGVGTLLIGVIIALAVLASRMT